MSVVIEARGLGKRYRLGVMNTRRLYEDVHDFFLRLTGRGELTQKLGQDGKPLRVQQGEIWALRDMDLEVKDGDVVGVIGKNGSGKSTFLKLLSRITAPTEGRARIRGRVASLLEVGTGFHPELTGRENIFLNGAILGMSQRDIRKQFDQIVDFAGIENFIDTPVKRYSSGMYVRLAFAVAAHLDPDILIIDEVLAVGDATFQRKCLSRISGAAKEGRTILFVSHQAAAVENLCKRGVVLDQGRKVFEGTQTEALEFYAKRTDAAQPLAERQDRRGNGPLRVSAIEIRGGSDSALITPMSGKDCEFWLRYTNPGGRKYNGLRVELFVRTHFDAPVFTQGNYLCGVEFENVGESGVFVCRIPRLPLPAGLYRLSYRIRANMGYEMVDEMKGAAEMEVVEGDFFNTGNVASIHHGVALVDAEWRLESVS